MGEKKDQAKCNKATGAGVIAGGLAGAAAGAEIGAGAAGFTFGLSVVIGGALGALAGALAAQASTEACDEKEKTKSRQRMLVPGLTLVGVVVGAWAGSRVYTMAEGETLETLSAIHLGWTIIGALLGGIAGYLFGDAQLEGPS